MFERNPHYPLAADPRGEDEFLCPDRQRPAACHPGEDRGVENADGKDGVEGGRPEDGGDQDGDDQRRKGEDEVVAAHHQIIDHAPVVGRRQQAERHAERHADTHRDDGHSD